MAPGIAAALTCDRAGDETGHLAWRSAHLRQTHWIRSDRTVEAFPYDHGVMKWWDLLAARMPNAIGRS